jgi:hypothetical protein
MRHPILAPRFSIREQQLSATNLSPTAESGAVASSYFVGCRCRTPSDWPSAVSRFLAPAPPKPSAASKPMPKRRSA